MIDSLPLEEALAAVDDLYEAYYEAQDDTTFDNPWAFQSYSCPVRSLPPSYNWPVRSMLPVLQLVVCSLQDVSMHDPVDTYDAVGTHDAPEIPKKTSRRRKQKYGMLAKGHIVKSVGGLAATDVVINRRGVYASKKAGRAIWVLLPISG